MNKHKLISIMSLALIVIFSCLAWESRINSLKRNHSILIKLGDYQFTGEPQVHDDVVYFVKNNKCKAFSRICPHLGCKVDVDEHNNCLLCPCHGSRFSYEGVPITGPATEKLREFKCEVDKPNNIIRIYTYDEI